VTIVIAAHNEESTIEARIEDAISQDIDCDLQILVVSDGSTDRTDEIVAAHSDPRVSLLRSTSSAGKTAAQNHAFNTISDEVVVLTDADSRYAPGALAALLQPLADPSVGMTTGAVSFFRSDSDLSTSQSRYWRMELELRQQESRLNMLAVASGPSIAIRRSLIQPMREDVGDDCLLPLQVVSQGCRVVHCPSAIVRDRMPDSPRGELHARARMTARNWVGTWSFPRLLNPLRCPRIAIGLWSHKIMRWLSPLWLTALGGSSVLLALQGGPWRWVWAPIAAAFVAFVAGWLGALFGRTVPIAGAAWSFMVANLGFALGLLLVIRGVRITSYRNVEAS